MELDTIVALAAKQYVLAARNAVEGMEPGYPRSRDLSCFFSHACETIGSEHLFLNRFCTTSHQSNLLSVAKAQQLSVQTRSIFRARKRRR
jgi:hypothetical protein